MYENCNVNERITTLFKPIKSEKTFSYSRYFGGKSDSEPCSITY